MLSRKGVQPVSDSVFRVSLVEYEDGTPHVTSDNGAMVEKEHWRQIRNFVFQLFDKINATDVVLALAEFRVPASECAKHFQLRLEHTAGSMKVYIDQHLFVERRDECQQDILDRWHSFFSECEEFTAKYRKIKPPEDDEFEDDDDEDDEFDDEDFFDDSERNDG